MHSSNWLTTLYFHHCYLLACNMVTVQTNNYYYELTHGIPLGPRVLTFIFLSTIKSLKVAMSPSLAAFINCSTSSCNKCSHIVKGNQYCIAQNFDGGKV